MAKDPARVAAGKKAWAKLSPAKKAAVRARLKRIRPNKGGGSTSVAKKPTGGGGGGSTAVSTGSNNKPARIGKAYTAGKAAVILVAPLTDEGLAELGGFKNPMVVGARAAKKFLSLPYAYNLAVLGVDLALDKKFAQATALSHGSPSAWLPEGYLILVGWDQISKFPLTSPTHARYLHDRLVRTIQGYDVVSNSVMVSDPDFRTYRYLKHGGQLLRRLHARSGFVKRMLKPLDDVRKMFTGKGSWF